MEARMTLLSRFNALFLTGVLSLGLWCTGHAQDTLVIEINLPDLKLANAYIRDAKLTTFQLSDCKLCPLGMPTDKCQGDFKTYCEGLIATTARIWETFSVIVTEKSPGCVTVKAGGTVKTRC